MCKHLLFAVLLGLIVTGCSDHDDPKLAPIDTSKVKIRSDVKVLPSESWSWYSTSDELTVRVEDVDISAPKGVVLRSIDLAVNGRVIAEKPFSGEMLEFKVPLTYMAGRLNMSVLGNLIQKNARDAQIIIADNLQQIVFDVMPEFDCTATLDVTVKGRSTSGEELNRNFQTSSSSILNIVIPQQSLYWTPDEGTASTLEVTMTGSANVTAINSTLEAAVTGVHWNGDQSDSPSLSLTLSNTPGSFAAKKLILLVNTQRHGVWENINTGDTNLTYVFSVTESK